MSGIRKLFEAARADAIHLGLGEPHVQPAPHILEAHQAAIRDGKNRYSATAGIAELREALAERYADRWDGCTVDNIGVTAGSTAALFAALFSLVENGEEVLIPDPGFVLYGPHVRLAGGTPVPYPVAFERGFQIDVDAMAEAITPDTRAIIVNGPGNPTGVALDEASVAGVAELAEQHDLWVLSDEAYDAITFDVEHHSMLGRVENLVYLNTFSKRYAMTGWRVGYAIAPPEMATHLRTVAYHMYAAPNTPAQYAALAALEGPQEHVGEMVAQLRERRDLMARLLGELPGTELVVPTGAFYAFPRIETSMSSVELAMALLEAGLVTAPGSGFGERGEGHIRFSFATELDKIEAGLDVARKVLEGL